jgi:hypothetical protein
MYEKTFMSAEKMTNGNNVTHNTKHTILFNKTKFTPYSVPPAHAPASVFPPGRTTISLWYVPTTVSSSIDRGRYLDFPLCTIPTVCRYEKYGVFGKHRTSRSGIRRNSTTGEI